MSLIRPSLQNLLTLILLLTIFSGQKALAYDPNGPSAHITVNYDAALEEGEVIKLTDVLRESSIHADGTLSNFWNVGVAGNANDDNYNGIFDYRVEAHTPLYNVKGHSGQLITRVQGFGSYDENIRGFFDDELIDIPELLLQDVSIKGNNAIVGVFGKFAHRRYIDKDEIAPDNFDIGERPFFGAPQGYPALIHGVNEFRDSDLFISRQANGVYGFAFAVKNLNSERFLDGWGAKQAFVFARLNDFGDNFYGASEINKNWGEKNPGQLNLGVVYGQDAVLRVTSDNFVSPYFSLTQKYGRLIGYAKYNFANSTNLLGQEFTLHNMNAGFHYELTNKDLLSINWVRISGSSNSGLDSSDLLVSYWRHKFNETLSSTVYVANGFNTGTSPLLLGGLDEESLAIGFNVQLTI